MRGAKARQAAAFVLKIKLLGRGLRGPAVRQGGLLLGGDNLEAQLGRSFAIERLGEGVVPPEICSNIPPKNSIRRCSAQSERQGLGWRVAGVSCVKIAN